MPEPPRCQLCQDRRATITLHQTLAEGLPFSVKGPHGEEIHLCPPCFSSRATIHPGRMKTDKSFLLTRANVQVEARGGKLTVPRKRKSPGRSRDPASRPGDRGYPDGS